MLADVPANVPVHVPGDVRADLRDVSGDVCEHVRVYVSERVCHLLHVVVPQHVRSRSLNLTVTAGKERHG